MVSSIFSPDGSTPVFFTAVSPDFWKNAHQLAPEERRTAQCALRCAWELQLLTWAIWFLNASWLSESSRIPSTLAITSSRAMAAATNGSEVFIWSLCKDLGTVRVSVAKLRWNSEDWRAVVFVAWTWAIWPWDGIYTSLLWNTAVGPPSDWCTNVCSGGVVWSTNARCGRSLCYLCQPLQKYVCPIYGTWLGHWPLD